MLKVFHFIGLGCLWWLLSGHTEPLILSFGLLSVALVMLISWKMEILDSESFPLPVFGRAIGYWLWLAFEVLKANVDVAKRILDPRLPIKPIEADFPHDLQSNLGKSTLANSITLTPGTITMSVGENSIHIHALSESGVNDLKASGMADRVKRFEGK